MRASLTDSSDTMMARTCAADEGQVSECYQQPSCCIYNNRKHLSAVLTNQTVLDGARQELVISARGAAKMWPKQP
jgi:hypothetical protein